MNDEKNLNEENENVAEETAEAVEEVTEATAEEAPEETTETVDEAPEETEETVEETAAEVSEEATEAVEEVTETAEGEFVMAQSAETALGDNTDDTDGAVSTNEESGVEEAVGAVQTAFEAAAENTDTKSKKGGLIAIIVAAALVIALIVIALVMYGPSLFNKYNRMGYVDVSGRTIQEIADANEMELEEFLERWGLPSDMPANTTESAAYNNIPFGNMAKTYGLSTDDFKKFLQLGDDVTDETPWGEAINKATVGAYVGEEYLDSFKEYYGLGDEVTAETLWGDIRQTVEEKQREERIADEKAEAEATEAPVEEAPAEEAPTEDAPAEDAPAEEAPAA